MRFADLRRAVRGVFYQMFFGNLQNGLSFLFFGGHTK